MSREVVILLAHERSGSNLLRSVLNTGKRIRCEGEVCKIESAEERESPYNFFNHRHEMIKQDGSLAFPLVENQNKLIESYFEKLLARGKHAERVVIDIKYAHVHNFNSFWVSNSMPPHLLRFAAESGTRVIHLSRRDPLLATLSNELAIARKVWNTADRAQLIDTKITVNAHRVWNETCALNDWREEMARNVQKTKHLSLYYEDLIEDGLMSASVSKSVAEFLDIEETWNREPRLVKVSPPPRDFVENLDEVEAFFAERDSSHLWTL